MRPPQLPLWLFVACCGCTSAPAPVAPATPDAPRTAAEQGPAAPVAVLPAGALRVRSNDGTYTLAYRPVDGPIERGAPFVIEVWVLDAAGRHLVTDADVHVDAGMPQHEHGMNRVPAVHAVDPGRFRAEGLLFHMDGRWELYLDVTRGALTERGQFEVTLE